MELSAYFKSVLEQDRCAVVICNLNHEIIYMNPVAKERYVKYGGAELVGKSLLTCHNEKSQQMIKRTVGWFAENKDNNIIFTYHNDKENKDAYMVALRDDNGGLIGYYEKHEYRNPETAKIYDFK